MFDQWDFLRNEQIEREGEDSIIKGKDKSKKIKIKIKIKQSKNRTRRKSGLRLLGYSFFIYQENNNTKFDEGNIKNNYHW